MIIPSVVAAAHLLVLIPSVTVARVVGVQVRLVVGLLRLVVVLGLRLVVRRAVGILHVVVVSFVVRRLLAVPMG